MAISRYWVGQIPARPIAIEVRDSSGNPMDFMGASDFKVILVGSDNEVIDTTGALLNSSGYRSGRLVFTFPKDRSLFDKTGEYLLQLEIIGSDGSKDFTTEHHMRVSRLGGTY